MTLATKITVFRLVMVPVFVAFGLLYGESVNSGAPDEFWRWAAIITFTTAALSDALDGYIARQFNQRSRLGTFLDPIADKALMLSAIFTLSFANWGQYLPLWFSAVIIARDLIQVSGAIAIGHIAGDIKVIHHWTGKLATVLQVVTIGWVFFLIQVPALWCVATAAAVFTIWSAALYIHAGLSQLPEH